MSRTDFLMRKCSPLIALGAGAAVCITGGNVAEASTGTIAGTNGGMTSFGSGDTLKAFGPLASWNIDTYFGSLRFVPAAGTPSFVAFGPFIKHTAAGVDVTNGLAWTAFSLYGNALESNNFIPVRFQDGGNRFGWIHCVSTTAGGPAMKYVVDTWGYNSTTVGGSIKTLSDTLTARKLTLSNGDVKLHWTDKNEDGVSRYEVQAKDDKGEWQAVDSDVPGEGRYNVKADSDGNYRLVVEKIDGTTEEVAF